MKIAKALTLLAVGVVSTGCSGQLDEGIPSDEASLAEGEGAILSTATFSGVVQNEQGSPLAGVSVTVNGTKRITGADGKYAMSVLTSSSGYKLSIEGTGVMPVDEYLSAARTDLLHKLKAAFVQAIDPTKDNLVIAPSGAKVALKANTLVDASGVVATSQVNVTIATYSPRQMPGDFTATNLAGQKVALESVGAIYVGARLASTGAALNLKTNTSAEGFIPLGAGLPGMLSCVGANTCAVKMWSFDVASGLWKEKAANIKVAASGTSFTMVRGTVNGVVDNTGLGRWNADIQKTTPACTVIEFVGVPDECFRPASVPATDAEPGILLDAQLPNSDGVMIPQQGRITMNAPWTVLYNITENKLQSLQVTFPAGAPDYCAANLLIDSDPPAAAGFPSYSPSGGVTKFNSGAAWGGVGFPDKPGTSTDVTKPDVVAGDHPCHSHVQIISNAEPPLPMKNAMTWSLLKSAKPDASNAYVRPGSDSKTNPYTGDTWTKNSLPVLCINENSPAYPGTGVLGVPYQTPGGAWRNTWSYGTVGLTDPVPGTSLTSLAVANDLCAAKFGPGYRMAEFHDGDPTVWAGWDFWGRSVSTDLTPYVGMRYWVSINDQNANPW